MSCDVMCQEPLRHMRPLLTLGCTMAATWAGLSRAAPPPGGYVSSDELFMEAIYERDFESARQHFEDAMALPTGPALLREGSTLVLNSVLSVGAADLLDDVLSAFTRIGLLPIPPQEAAASARGEEQQGAARAGSKQARRRPSRYQDEEPSFPQEWEQALGRVLQARSVAMATEPDMFQTVPSADLLHCMEVLLKHGADPHKVDQKGNDLLATAIKNRDLEAAKLLVTPEACFDPPAHAPPGHLGWPALLHAADAPAWRLKVSKQLLKASRRVRQQEPKNPNEFWHRLAAELSADRKLLAWQLPLARDLAAWSTAEAQAVFHPMPVTRPELWGTVVSAEAFRLLDLGVETFTMELLRSCAQAAGVDPSARVGNHSALQNLLLTGFKATSSDDMPRPSLLAAVTSAGQVSLVRALLEQLHFQPNPNPPPLKMQRDEQGKLLPFPHRASLGAFQYHMSPLHIARSLGLTEAAELLLAHGADPDARDVFGRTPMQLGVWLDEQRNRPGQAKSPLSCDFLVLSEEESATYTSNTSTDAWTAHDRFARDFLMVNRPVLLKGAAKSWPAFQRWARPDYFAQSPLGETSVAFGYIPYAGAYGGEAGGKKVLGEYMAQSMRINLHSPASVKSWRTCANLSATATAGGCSDSELSSDTEGQHEESGGKCLETGAAAFDATLLNDLKMFPPYIFDRTVVAERSKELAGDLVTPPGLGGKGANRWQFMMGPAGSGSPLHFHIPAWNALIVGRKYWTIYPSPVSLMSAGPRDVSVLETGANLLPKPWHCTQEAGDILFVPNAFVHSVMNLCDSVGVAVETM
eukprot:g42600.t1